MTITNTLNRSIAPSTPDLSAKAAGIGVVAAMLLALVLRLSGVEFMLPHQTNVDERVFASQVDLFRGLKPVASDLDNYMFYPELVPWITSVTTPFEVSRPPARTLEQHREAGAAKFRWLRTTVAWLSVLLVPGTFFLARRFVTRRFALTAAWFVAVCVLNQWHAQQARPHPVVAVTTIGGVLGALFVLRRGDWRAYTIAGLACGLALGTLQSGAAAVLSLCAAHVLRRHERMWRAQVYFLGSLVVWFVAGAAFYPFVFDPGTGRISIDMLTSGARLHLSGHGLKLSEFDFTGFVPLAPVFLDFDPLIAVFATIGLVTCAASLVRTRFHLEHGREVLVVLAHALPYLFMICFWQRSFQRFLMPLLPYVAILAAVGLWWVAQRLGRWRVVGAALVVVVLGMQSFTALKLAQLRQVPDTATDAADWIASHLARTDRIALIPTLDLPLLRQDRGLVDRAQATGRDYKPWARYQLTIPAEERAMLAFDMFNMPASELALTDPAAYVRAIDADYMVVQEFGPDIRINLGRIREAVMQAGTRVARFTPWDPDRSGQLPLLFYWDSEFSAESQLSLRMLAMRSLGAPVEIYRMR